MIKDNYYLIGPGGVGKSTTGKIVSSLTGLPFVDLDLVFCDTHINIGDYIDHYGYEAYIRENSSLFSDILDQQSEPRLMALSSGFLATSILPHVVHINRTRVQQSGTSILLLPDRDIERACEIVIERQLGRGFGLVFDGEKKKFLDRVDAYSRFTKNQVISSESPDRIASIIADMIRSLNA